MPERDEYDSPWKEALRLYFPDFIALLFPDAHAGIDWKAGYSFVDKELQQPDPESDAGVRTVDKLVEVRCNDGENALVLVHVEVQAQPESDFARRMFTYNYRIFDQYEHEVVSLAVLADERRSWRPSGFGYGRWGCRMRLDFPVVKLLDFQKRRQELAASPNPFAVIVEAHLRTQATRRDSDGRFEWKLALTKRLYNKGYTREEIRSLYRFIDWLMTLPDELQERFEREIAAFEKEKKMTFVTGFEKKGLKKGLKKGREEGLKEGRLKMARENVVEALEIHFGPVPDVVGDTIDEIANEDDLRALLKHAIQAESLEAFERALEKIRPQTDGQ